MRLLVFVCLIGVLFTSCKSEDELLEGTWKLSSAKYEKKGSSDKDSTATFQGLELTFGKDGELLWKQDAFTRQGRWTKRTMQKYKGVDQNGNNLYRSVSGLYLSWNDTSQQTLFVDDLNVRKKAMQFARNYNGNNLDPATERLLFEFDKK